MKTLFRNKTSKLIVVLSVLLSSWAGNATDRLFADVDLSAHVLDEYYTSEFCATFLSELKEGSTKIRVIPPDVETTDFYHPDAQRYVQDCRKERFTAAGPTGSTRIITEEGKVAWVDFAPDEDHPPYIDQYALDDFALYRSKWH